MKIFIYLAILLFSSCKENQTNSGKAIIFPEPNSQEKSQQTEFYQKKSSLYKIQFNRIIEKKKELVLENHGPLGILTDLIQVSPEIYLILDLRNCNKIIGILEEKIVEKEIPFDQEFLKLIKIQTKDKIYESTFASTQNLLIDLKEVQENEEFKLYPSAINTFVKTGLNSLQGKASVYMMRNPPNTLPTNKFLHTKMDCQEVYKAIFPSSAGQIGLNHHFVEILNVSQIYPNSSTIETNFIFVPNGSFQKYHGDRTYYDYHAKFLRKALLEYDSTLDSIQLNQKIEFEIDYDLTEVN